MASTSKLCTVCQELIDGKSFARHMRKHKEIRIPLIVRLVIIPFYFIRYFTNSVFQIRANFAILEILNNFKLIFFSEQVKVLIIILINQW